MTEAESLKSEVELLSRWYARQILRNVRGEGAPEPLFSETGNALIENGVHVFYNAEENRVQMRIAGASAVSQGDDA